MALQAEDLLRTASSISLDTAISNVSVEDKIRIVLIDRTPNIDFSDPTMPHDKILLMYETKFFVESQFLSAISPVFKKMFEESGETVELSIPNVKTDQFKEFLQYIYGTGKEVKDENCSYLVDLALQLSTPTLIQDCLDFMDDISGLSFPMEHMLDVFEVAFKHNLRYYIEMFGSRFFTYISSHVRELPDELRVQKSRIAQMSPEAQAYILQWHLTPNVQWWDDEELAPFDLLHWSERKLGLPIMPVIDFCDPTIPHDRILVVEGKDFYVNSKFLGVWGGYFRTLLHGPFKESNQYRVELQEISADDFEHFLQAIWQNGRSLTVKNCAGVMELGWRFDAPGIVHRCGRFIASRATPGEEFIHYLNMLEVAILHNMEDIKMSFGADWFNYFEEDNLFEENASDIASCSQELRDFILQFQSGAFKNCEFFD